MRRAYPEVGVRVRTRREKHVNKTKTEKTGGEALRKEKTGVDVRLIDQWLAEHYEGPEDILGKQGLLAQLTKAVVERALGRS